MKTEGPIRTVKRFLWGVLAAAAAGAALALIYGFEIAFRGLRPAILLVGFGAITAVFFMLGFLVLRPSSPIALLSAAAIGGAAGGFAIWYFTGSGLGPVLFVVGGALFVPLLLLCDSMFSLERLKQGYLDERDD